MINPNDALIDGFSVVVGPLLRAIVITAYLRLWFGIQRKPVFETRAWFETENPLELELPDYIVDRLLTVFTHHFRQNQLRRIRIIRPAEAGLHS
jgi:hypothetical protein